jgi:DNA polymerase I
MIIAAHDAYVFEAPLGHLAEVGELTRRVMYESVQEMFTCLRPRAESQHRVPVVLE